MNVREHRNLGYALRWPFAGEVLFMARRDAGLEEVVRDLVAIGCPCQVAESRRHGLELLERESGISMVIIDHTFLARSPGADIALLRVIRPDVVVVGSTTRHGGHGFRAANVKQLLFRPWNAQDLISVVAKTVLRCVVCHLALPLRFPNTGEPARDWVCRGCDCRYRAVLREDCPTEAFRNVRLVAQGERLLEC